MQELYLLGVIPSRRSDIVANSLLKIFNEPNIIYEYWMVYRPKDVPINLPRQPDSWLRLCGQLDTVGSNESDWIQRAQWAIHLEGTSEPKREGRCGIRPVSRAKLTNGSPMEFVENLGYEFSHEYLVQGLKYTSNNCTIRLFQTLIPSQKHSIDPPFHPLAEDQAWLLHTYTHVADANNQKAMVQAEANLEHVKNLLLSVCELRNVRI
ncbi:mediator complex subunit Med18 [Schizosaccharomyces osmophilus]|uniref:Mediator of RNA polymerase II transcription subunit 18 n=1 Tax=Schizosaccharomyces osmophilus TaxID=2545709 RepID=A0AAF0AUK7_9SCHI|nr:mediator complex subunit Med18 [Schizosaccharomyces osmophilus]WBW71478.1 mediator complex subunit Med18 [Schizosaccharomyces osmophilus]